MINIEFTKNEKAEIEKFEQELNDMNTAAEKVEAEIKRLEKEMEDMCRRIEAGRDGLKTMDGSYKEKTLALEQYIADIVKTKVSGKYRKL